jgi:hypothetical protein
LIAGMSLNGLMFSSIPAPRNSLFSGGPLFYTYVCLTASVPGRVGPKQQQSALFNETFKVTVRSSTRRSS